MGYHQKMYDVAVIGAGSSGLSAIDEIKKVTRNFVLINHGEMGTTCARVGCMPSKTLIQIANGFFSRKHFSDRGILGSKHLRVNSAAVLKNVRDLRDRFVKGILEETAALGDRSLEGFVQFLDPSTLKVGQKVMKAKRIIIATGTAPMIPQEWSPFSDSIITTDQLFEMKELPKSMITLGLGPVGIEMSQALSRLGVKMIGVGRSGKLATLTDPSVNAFARKLVGSEFPIELGKEGKVSSTRAGLGIALGRKTLRAEMFLLSLGRRHNLGPLRLNEIGVKLDEEGIPFFNANSLQVGKLPIFIAGDATHYRPVLHEAIDEGRIAGFNSVQDSPKSFARRVPMTITFSEPNIATVGQTFSELSDRNFLIGEAHLNEGRAIILSQEGILRIYGASRTGALLGAEMIAPHGEHLAHLIACMIHNRMTVFDALKLPFYHPVMEEGLYEALKNLAKKVVRRGRNRKAPIDLTPIQP